MLITDLKSDFWHFWCRFFKQRLKIFSTDQNSKKCQITTTLLHIYAMHTNESVSAMRLNRAFACGRYSFRAFINAQNFSWISRILVVLLRFMKIVIYVRLVVTRNARAHYSPNERLNRCRTYMRTTKANKMQNGEKVKEIAWHGQSGREREKNRIKRQERYQMNSLTYNKKFQSVYEYIYVTYFSNHIVFVSMVYLVLFGRRHLLPELLNLLFFCRSC